LLSVTILLGIKMRLSLIVSLFLYVGLSVGLMATSEQHGIAWLGIHVIMSVMALKMVNNAKWVVFK
jgi:thiosulfate dehydrogenase (quinone) large subunit